MLLGECLQAKQGNHTGKASLWRDRKAVWFPFYPLLNSFLGFPVAQLVKKKIHLLHCNRPQFDSWVGKIPWRRDRLPTQVFLGFPCGSADKEPACNDGDLGSIPGLGRSPGEGKGYPLQYSGLENTVHGVAKSQTQQSNFHFNSFLLRKNSSSLQPMCDLFWSPNASILDQGVGRSLLKLERQKRK